MQTYRLVCDVFLKILCIFIQGVDGNMSAKAKVSPYVPMTDEQQQFSKQIKNAWSEDSSETQNKQQRREQHHQQQHEQQQQQQQEINCKTF